MHDSPSINDALRQRIEKKYFRRINKQGALLITSHRFRDQGRNVADSLQKLRELILAVATAPKKRKKTKPTKASNRRRLENKRRVSDKKRSRKPVSE